MVLHVVYVQVPVVQVQVDLFDVVVSQCPVLLYNLAHAFVMPYSDPILLGCRVLYLHFVEKDVLPFPRQGRLVVHRSLFEGQSVLKKRCPDCDHHHLASPTLLAS